MDNHLYLQASGEIKAASSPKLFNFEAFNQMETQY